MQQERLAEMLGVSESEINRLCECGLILPRPEPPTPTPKIDYEELATSYQSLMAQLHLGTHAELARHLGVSRMWVSKVLKKNRCPTK